MAITEVGGYVLCADKLEERRSDSAILRVRIQISLSQIKMKAKESGNTPLPAKDNTLGKDFTYVR